MFQFPSYFFILSFFLPGYCEAYIKHMYSDWHFFKSQNFEYIILLSFKIAKILLRNSVIVLGRFLVCHVSLFCYWFQNPLFCFHLWWFDHAMSHVWITKIYIIWDWLGILNMDLFFPRVGSFQALFPLNSFLHFFSFPLTLPLCRSWSIWCYSLNLWIFLYSF